MRAEYDFSEGERGKFYNPKAVFNVPIYLEKDVDDFSGTDLGCLAPGTCLHPDAELRGG